MSLRTFPEHFLWGAATSAYQVEGSPLADGAGPSNWHRFSHLPGRTYRGQTGDVACDGYRRWPEDVALMRQLGLNAYRFSIAWSRILPAGTGAVNQAGLDHYDRLVDALLEAGIAPNITLYHWDLPAALDECGGWLERDSAGWFADYAAIVFRALADRVALWTTLNEPWVVMDAGYLHGVHAPGHASIFEAPRVAHNLLRAHAAAVDVYRAEAGADRPGGIGLVVNLEPKYPATDSPADRAATARATAYANRFFLEPALLGRYPEELPELFGEAWPEAASREAGDLARRLDFVGINYYFRAVVRDDPCAPPSSLTRVANVPQPRSMHTELGWEVAPDAFADILQWVRATYGDVPIHVTENGSAFYDPPVAFADPLPDPHRVHYLREHLRALRRAIAAGVDVRGYFAWSLLDNFEWSQGFSKRFGLVHVDFETQKRTLKESGRLYADIVRSNGDSLD